MSTGYQTAGHTTEILTEVGLHIHVHTVERLSRNQVS